MHEALRTIGSIGVVPVIKLDDTAQALPLGRALLAGRLPVAEITFRTAAAEESIRVLAGELPDLLVGAGTVLTVQQAESAIAAGAKFVVAPGFNPKVVEYCLERGVPITPGVSSPTEIERALEAGLEVAKFFPAENNGGVSMLKALAGPYGGRISFVPTGGVTPGNMSSYLACSNVLAVGGSWMVPGDLLQAGNYAAVEALCRSARMAALGLSLLHVGINPGGEGDPMANAATLAEVLGMPFREGRGSAFVGDGFEILKTAGRGAKGHIAIRTLSVERALAWFADFGFEPVEDSVIRKGGKPVLAYLDKPFMDFALHLTASA